MIALKCDVDDSEGVFLSKDGKEAWLQTFSGRRVSVLNPSPNQIAFEDICVAISKQCRFNGHATHFYSVSQHCVIGAELAKERFGEDIAKEFLLHDATEAYVGDLIRPVKCMIPQFKEIEQRFWKAIAIKFDLPLIHSPEVKYLDNVMLAWEKRDFLPHSEVWPNLPNISGMKLPTMESWSWKKAQGRYYSKFMELFGG